MTFPAPDNLTAYRLMAVAADAGERFGSGDKRFTVTQAAAAAERAAALPRTSATKPRAACWSSTTPARRARVTVDTTVSGARLRGGAHQEIAVAGERTRPVLFPLRAERAGELKLRVKAVLGAETDGPSSSSCPMHHPSRVETKLVAEGHTDGREEIPLKLPAGIMPASASLEVSTGSGRPRRAWRTACAI